MLLCFFQRFFRFFLIFSLCFYSCIVFHNFHNLDTSLKNFLQVVSIKKAKNHFQKYFKTFLLFRSKFFIIFWLFFYLVPIQVIGMELILFDYKFKQNIREMIEIIPFGSACININSKWNPTNGCEWIGKWDSQKKVYKTKGKMWRKIRVRNIIQ